MPTSVSSVLSAGRPPAQRCGATCASRVEAAGDAGRDAPALRQARTTAATIAGDPPGFRPGSYQTNSRRPTFREGGKRRSSEGFSSTDTMDIPAWRGQKSKPKGTAKLRSTPSQRVGSFLCVHRVSVVEIRPEESAQMNNLRNLSSSSSFSSSSSTLHGFSRTRTRTRTRRMGENGKRSNGVMEWCSDGVVVQ